MKKFRKLLGVIIGQPDGPYQAKLLSGILEEAFSLNYDAAVFATFTKDKNSQSWYDGEMNIFSMINYAALDGIFFVPDTLRIDDADKRIEAEIIKNFKKPVISVDIQSRQFTNIFTDDIQNIKKIISHLIEVHKLTDIAFMTGIKGHLHSTNRLTGYYEALIEHGIPIDRSRVFYGDFWYDKGEEVVRALIEDGRPMPQAIACANDTMAISVCEALKARGYKVPEDIAVTGYDSIDAGINYVPGITSSDIPADDTGRRAARLMHSLISGTKFTDDPCGAEIIIGKSCGCSRNAAEEMRKELRMWQDNDAFGDFNSTYNFMLESLISEQDLEKYIHSLAWHTFHIGNSSSFYLALCEDWDNLGETDLNLQYREAGYSKTMTLPLRKMGENARVNPEYTFDLSEMLPMIYERRPKPTAFFFGPVHFNNRCFGYSVFSYGDDTSSTYPSCYRQWMKFVCVSLESLRRHRNLMYLYKKMEDNAVTDLLTGIYNRNGFNLYTEDILKSVKSKGEDLIVILGDMNNLKYINDTFGHMDGDFAIKSVADAFNEACGKKFSCFRIGGDEYVLIGGTNSAEEEIERISASIVRHLKNVNDTADKPYSISVSIGSFFGSSEEYDTIERPLAIADERMFEAKQKFKRDENFDYRKQRAESITEKN